jgi:hypothetical protein
METRDKRRIDETKDDRLMELGSRGRKILTMLATQRHICSR